MKLTDPRQLTAEQHRTAIHQLKPPGLAISDDPKDNINRILNANASDVQVLVDGTAAIGAEANPTNADLTLAEWLKTASAETKQQVVSIVTKEGIKTLAELQREFPEFHISEQRQARVGDPAGTPLTRRAIVVQYYSEIRRLRIGDPVGSPFWWPVGLAEAQKKIKRHVGAHIRVIFRLIEGTRPDPDPDPNQLPARALLLNERPLTLDGKYLTV